MTAGALAFALAFVPPAVRTRTIVSGAGGLVGAAAIVAAPTLDLTVFVLLALGVLHASVTGGRSFAVRLRPPVLAAAMIAIALVLIRVQGPAVLDRFAAVGIVLCRLPLYLVYRSAPVDRGTAERSVNLVVAAALAGSAPFAGFAARILLLRGATQLYWPLALVLAIAMLLWLPSSLRLGRSVGLPRGRRAVGVALVLALNVAAGLYPLPILSAAHL